MPSKKANNNSRKRAKTTGVDTTTTADKDEDRQQGRSTTTTASSSITSRHVQDSFQQEQPDGGDWTRSNDARNLLNQVVEAGAATATVQDIDFEDEFEQMLHDVEQEGVAENADVAFYNESSDEDDDEDNNNRQGQEQQQEEQPQRRETRQREEQPQNDANNNNKTTTTMTSVIHQKFDLKILQQIEEWIQSDPNKRDDAARAGAENGDLSEDGNNENDHNDYESKYTLDDIINF